MYLQEVAGAHVTKLLYKLYGSKLKSIFFIKLSFCFKGNSKLQKSVNIFSGQSYNSTRVMRSPIHYLPLTISSINLSVKKGTFYLIDNSKSFLPDRKKEKNIYLKVVKLFRYIGPNIFQIPVLMLFKLLKKII